MIDFSGQFGTTESRETLRRIYLEDFLPRYSTRFETFAKAEWEIATRISIGPHERKATYLALKRWAHEGKRELWDKDEEKSLRVVENLKTLMAEDKHIAKTLSENSKIARVRRTAETLSALVGQVGISEIEQYCGVFELKSDLENYNNMGDDTSKPPTYWKIYRPDQIAFLLFHEFTFEQGRLFPIEKLGRRTSGFIIVGRGGNLVRFVIDDFKSERRWVDIYSPLNHERMRRSIIDANGIDAAQYCFIASSSEEINNMAGTPSIYTKFAFLKLVDDRTEDFINETLSGEEWDINL